MEQFRRNCENAETIGRNGRNRRTDKINFHKKFPMNNESIEENDSLMKNVKKEEVSNESCR